MPEKRYKLQTALAAPMARGANFQFKLAYGLAQADGSTRIVNTRSPNCPIITIGKTGTVVQTTNEIAQRMLENFIVPQKTKRGVGNAPPKRRPAGNLFVDVTSTVPTADVDLDPFFTS